MPSINIPRIVVAGTQSGSGKTTVAMGLMKALSQKGYRVAPFKVGPDYIDPMFHSAATKRGSRNLDGFMLDEGSIRRSFARGCIGADIAVIEGVMGLYDSHDGKEDLGSTAHISKVLRAPVILVLDVQRMARSAAAVVKGFKEFDRKVDLAGVVLNKVGSERHLNKLKDALKGLDGLEVIGAIRRDPFLKVPERHLGLVPVHELELNLDDLGYRMEKELDLKRILKIANNAPALRIEKEEGNQVDENIKTVGIIFDDSFRFYYRETISQINELARPQYIDALKDKALPEVDVLYIGGGFPEVFAKKLEANRSLRSNIHDYCDKGGRVYAECGGLMYLGESIEVGGEEFEMTGFLPVKTLMQDRYMGMGYTLNEVVRDNFIAAKGTILRGHEFHHSKAVLTSKADYAYRTLRGKGIDGEHDGLLKEGVLASYTHLHPLGHKRMIKALVSDLER